MESVAFTELFLVHQFSEWTMGCMVHTRAFPEVWWIFKTFISKLQNLFPSRSIFNLMSTIVSAIRCWKEIIQINSTVSQKRLFLDAAADWIFGAAVDCSPKGGRF